MQPGLYTRHSIDPVGTVPCACPRVPHDARTGARHCPYVILLAWCHQRSLSPTENLFPGKGYLHFRYCAIYRYCIPSARREGFYAPARGSNLRIVGLKERRRNGKEMPQFLVLHHFWFSLSPVGNNVGKGLTPFPRHLSPPSIHRHIRDLRRRTGYTCTILGSAGAYIRMA